MKKLTSILLLLLFVWTVQAQTAREEIRANRYYPLIIIMHILRLLPSRQLLLRGTNLFISAHICVMVHGI